MSTDTTLRFWFYGLAAGAGRGGRREWREIARSGFADSLRSLDYWDQHKTMPTEFCNCAVAVTVGDLPPAFSPADVPRTED